jgi:hypothetical protein
MARAMMNELDSARFDPLLILAVARNVGTAIDGATMRAESLVSSLAPNRYPMIDSCVISRSPQIAQRLRFSGRWRLHSRL